MSQLLTVNEVADLTRLSKATIYAYVCKREIPFTKLGTRTLFRLDEIEAWIADKSVKPIALSGTGR